jgi:hypothetical protein
VDAFSAFNIDSVVVYQVFIFWHLCTVVCAVSLSLPFAAVSFLLYVGTLFLRVEGHSSGLYPFLFFLFVGYLVRPLCVWSM